MARSVLFLVNDPVAPPAMLGEVFDELGYSATVFEVVPADRVDRPALSVDFPVPSAHDAVVALGARWAAYDPALTASWAGAEMALMRSADTAGVGVLGVCFGAQLLAAAHGGLVEASPVPEIGWHPVRTGAADIVPAGPWFQWHLDRFTPPPGAVELARNDAAVQAFRIGRSLGVQFHPELDAPLLQTWLDHDGAQAAALGVDVDRLPRRTAELVDDAAARLRALVRGFLGLAPGQP